MMTVLIFCLALSVLVFVHEWGHYRVAKSNGIRVDVFSIGFGKKIFSWKSGGTLFQIAPIPLGGYVKIFGQEPYEEAEGNAQKAKEIATHPEAFYSKTAWQKFTVVVAGPIMNFVFALLILPLVFMVGRLEPKIFSERPVVNQVVQDSPAFVAGLKAGDKILAVNEIKTPNWKELETQIALHPNQSVNLLVQREEQTQTMSVALTTHPASKHQVGYLGCEASLFIENDPVISQVRKNSPAEKAGLMAADRVLTINQSPIRFWTDLTDRVLQSQGNVLTIEVLREQNKLEFQVQPEKSGDTYLIGVQRAQNPDTLAVVRHGFVESLRLGFAEFIRLGDLTFQVLKKLFTGNLSPKSLGGPLQIAEASSTAAKSGLGDFFYFLAFLSLQLGVMNLLPVPVLDGGHVLFIVAEVVMGRPIPPRVRLVSMQVGMALLLGLMVFVTFNDIENMWGIFTRLKGIF